MPDLGGRHELEHRVDHPQAGAQDRHEPDPVGQLVRLHRLERRLDRDRPDPDVGQRLVAEQPRQLADDLAELLRLGRRRLRRIASLWSTAGWVETCRLGKLATVDGWVTGAPPGSDSAAPGIVAPGPPWLDARRGILAFREPCRRTEPVVTATRSAAPRSRPTPARSSVPIRRGAPPVLVRQTRNGIVESVHRGDVVEVDAAGRIVRLLGDADRVVTLRSCVKPFGLLALLEAGGIDAFELTPPEIAIMASSHSGEDIHVRTIQGIYRRAGVSQTRPRLRVRGHAPRRADGRPPGPGWREGRPGPPHVLRPALIDDPAGAPARLAARGLLAGRSSGPGRLSCRSGRGVRNGARPARDRDRRLRGRDLRVPAARRRSGLRVAGRPGGDPRVGPAQRVRRRT